MNQPSLFVDKPRKVAELTTSALAVIDTAFAAGSEKMLPLFSGGHDSLSACHVAAQHPRFGGDVHHIDTGIGSRKTRLFVEETCRELGWKLNVYKSPETYEKFVRTRGFPGPGRHQWIYVLIKERCVRQMMRRMPATAIVTGCRKEESTRRMGNVEAVKVGELSKKTGKVSNLKRIWTAPCHDWTHAEQRAYMDEHDLPRNPIKESPLGMSGECFCGAFAAPGELELVRRYAPDVAAEIDRLSAVAVECGTHSEWGTRPDKCKGMVVAQTGALCSSCDRRAAAAGLLFGDME